MNAIHIRRFAMASMIGLLPGLRAATPPPASPFPAELAVEIETSFRTHTLQRWFPACVDRERGGFNAEFDEAWKPAFTNIRHTVFQARMTWISAQVALRRQDLAPVFSGYARHGLTFLKGRSWDAEYGGFFSEVDVAGSPAGTFGTEKHVYANAFGIFAAAAVHKATGDKDALDLAVGGFRWIDEHAHDTLNGGYIEAITRNGTPILDPADSAGHNGIYDTIGTPYGCKSMNAHIHLLEAFTELYRVWPDPTLKSRIEELLGIVRDRIAIKPGCLNQILSRDWRAVPDFDSFGHDVETAYLLIEAAETIGDENPATLQMAKALVDHALDFGWDAANGGMADGGFAYRPLFDNRKIWWVQAESLNALLLMDSHFGGTTDRYRKAFLAQWAFIRDHQIDAVQGGWHDTVNADGTPIPGKPKGQFWKAAYHEGRAMLNVADRLKTMTLPQPFRF